MKDEWKRFLSQWILPVGIFGIALIVMFVSFTANIKESAAADYEQQLVIEASGYSAEIGASIKKIEAVASAMMDTLSDEFDNLPEEILSPIVKNSDAYASVYVDENGYGITDTGAEVEIGQLPYYESLRELPDKSIVYAEDDGFMNNSAFVVKMRTETDDNDFVLLYYPMNASSIRKAVTLPTDVDPTAFCIVTGKDGKIFASTSTEDVYANGKDYWSLLSGTNNSALVKRARTRVQSLMSGTFEAKVGNNSNVVVYTPIKDTSYILMIDYNKENIQKVEDKQVRSEISRIKWIMLLIALFILAVTIINIVQIYASSRNTDELKDKADTDQLTGLKNKLATEREIKEYIENHPDTIGLMFMVDIDNFKKINDTMGHAFGDEVLRELGRNIGINFRVSDIIGRTGGDEFTIFLKNLKEDANTLREAQKLIYFFRHFQVGDYVKYSVTASIGAAVFPAHGADFESLYKAADAAVYKSKKRGKNQLSFFDDRDRTPEEVAYADSHLIDIERKDETPIES